MIANKKYHTKGFIILRFIKKCCIYALLTLFTLALLWTLYFKVYGNFHKVDPNVYRSAQLYSFNLPHYIESHNIKSIINLQGPSPKEWYSDEKRISSDYNVSHFDFDISDRRLLTIQQMDALVKLMQEAPKPLLIHCRAGADRTSLASALYHYAVNKDLPSAQSSISILYGHIPWFGSRTITMDISFDNYVKAYPLKP